MMRRWALLLLLPFLLLGVEKAWARNNILLVQADDLSPRMMLGSYLHRSGEYRPVMPFLRQNLLPSGTLFSGVRASTPLCAPSRSALLSGQYSHNSGLVDNGFSAYGGWPGFSGSNALYDNVPRAMQDAGYHTAHFGKFLNQYAVGDNAPFAAPPGWDTWITDATDRSTRDYYGYYLFSDRDGSQQVLGPFGNAAYANNQNTDPRSCSIQDTTCNYHSDVISRFAAEEIRSATDPFYIQVDYHAPHGDAQLPAGPQPASRHLGWARNTPLPKRANFNEKDISDKPSLLRRRTGEIQQSQEKPLLQRYRKQIESLQAVDDGLRYLFQTLHQSGKADNTYIFFVSDNGFFNGEHRFLSGKFLAHEESSRLPLLVWGPDVPAGKRSAKPLSFLDIPASFVDISGAEKDLLDGTSLRPQWLGQETASRAILTEYIPPLALEDPFLPPQFDPGSPRPEPARRAPALRYKSLLIEPYKYTFYFKGGRELYRIDRDPFELQNLAYQKNYRPIVAWMDQQLDIYGRCKGAECLRVPPEVPSVP